MLFQSTHPHRVRLFGGRSFAEHRFVSIHAPTRGATYLKLCISPLVLFQSTHPHGVRPYTYIANGEHEEFQSTHPHGVRQNWAAYLLAPCCFNPRTHTGCDRLVEVIISGNTSFNPRTHTGCDPLQKLLFSLHRSFNPRTHTGCDFAPKMVRGLSAVSIHAPTRGATIAVERCCFYIKRFNPRTHTGCDLERIISAMSPQMFQSTHPHGVRP